MAEMLKIPATYSKGFTAFFAQDISVQESIIDFLIQAPIGFMPKKEIEIEGINIDSDDQFEILRSLFSLFFALKDSGLPNQEFSDQLVKTFKATKKPSLYPTEQFERQVTRLLTENRSIQTTVKAIGLLMETEHRFVGSRIITDVRPVFDTDENSVLTMMLVHSLRIRYYEDRTAKEIFFGFTLDDLKELKDHIERAEKKEASIREKLQSEHLSFINF